MKHTLNIFNETKVRVPRTAMVAVYNDLVQKKYSLNVVCVGDAFARRLNRAYRQKDTPANVLTFPPNDDGVAEIYLNTALAAKMAKKGDISIKRQVLFLYIHGILHLLGYRHGVQMELLEDRCITMYT